MHFFATIEDLESVIAYMVNELSLQIWEAYSPIDAPIRKIEPHTPLSAFGNAKGNVHYGAWREDFGFEPVFRTFALRPDIGDHRTCLEGPNIMFTNQGGMMDNGCLSNSDIKVWNEAGARQRSNYPDEVLDAVDWKAVQREAGRVNRFIKNKIAVAKLNSMPILPHAYSRFEAGEYSLWNFGEVVRPSCKKIERLK